LRVFRREITARFYSGIEARNGIEKDRRDTERAKIRAQKHRAIAEQVAIESSVGSLRMVQSGPVKF